MEAIKRILLVVVLFIITGILPVLYSYSGDDFPQFIFAVLLIISIVCLICSIVKMIKFFSNAPNNTSSVINRNGTSSRSRSNPSNKQIRTNQFNETLELLATTVKCDTFFSRLDFAYMIAKEQNSQNWIDHLDSNTENLVNRFIDRSYYNEVCKINELKTQSGKRNRINKYYDIMKSEFAANSKYCTDVNVSHLDEVVNDLRDMIHKRSNIVNMGDEYSSAVDVGDDIYTKYVSDEVRSVFCKAVFLDWASKGYLISNTDEGYPQYFKFDLKISHPKAYHSNLISEGYLTEADVSQKLNNLTLPKLKEILKKYGLSSIGAKQKLVELALTNISRENLEDETRDLNSLMLTDEGKAFLDLNYGFVEFYKFKHNIALCEYENQLKKGICNFGEAAENILKQRDSIPSYSSKLALAELYYKLKKYEEALSYYIQVLYYGCEDENSKYRNYLDDEDLFDEKLILAPHVIKRIHKLGEYFSPFLFDKCYVDNPKMKCLISKSKFEQIVENIVKTGNVPDETGENRD